MKKMIAAMLLSFALVVGTGVAASAATPQAVHQVKFTGWCVVNIFGTGLSTVAAIPASTVPGLDWLAWSGVGIAVAGTAKECGLDSFWHHVGYRTLCWDKYFLGWDSPDSPGGVKPIFAPGPPCHISPKTADGVFCQYIHGDDGACYAQFLNDLYFYNWLKAAGKA